MHPSFSVKITNLCHCRNHVLDEMMSFASNLYTQLGMDNRNYHAIWPIKKNSPIMLMYTDIVNRQFNFTSVKFNFCLNLIFLLVLIGCNAGKITGEYLIFLYFYHEIQRKL